MQRLRALRRDDRLHWSTLSGHAIDLRRFSIRSRNGVVEVDIATVVGPRRPVNVHRAAQRDDFPGASASAPATRSESPADPPGRTKAIWVPSGDQRSARPSSTTFRGVPPSGAGMTQASSCGGCPFGHSGIEGNQRAIWRYRKPAHVSATLNFERRRCGQIDRIAAAEEPHPHVGLPTRVRQIGDPLSIRRNRRAGFDALSEAD